MTEPSNPAVVGEAVAESCAQCSKPIDASDRVASGDRVFCRSCYLTLREELNQHLQTMSTDIAWWGFTVLTHVAFGLIAVAIGFLVGLGTVRFAGGKRSAGLQALSVAVALASYACANYLVNMTFINKALAEHGDPRRLGFPASPEMFFRVVTASAGVMDLVFLAIVVYEAWKIPRPVSLPPSAAA
jgi:hypothetical protein